MRVLVTGASGFVGRHLVPALVEAGHEVVALTRDADRYDPPEGVSVREGNLLESTGLEDAFEGIDAAYYLVHSMRTGRNWRGGSRGMEVRTSKKSGALIRVRSPSASDTTTARWPYIATT